MGWSECWLWEKGNSETGQPDGEWALTPSSSAWAGPTSDGDAATEVSRHSGDRLEPLFRMDHQCFRTISFCPVEAGLGDSCEISLLREWKSRLHPAKF